MSRGLGDVYKRQGYGYIVFNNFDKVQDIDFDNLDNTIDKFLDDKPRLKYTINRKYFNDGDYTEWYEQQSKNDTFLGTYEEYLDYLIEKYEEIIVTDDGCMYGEEGTMSYDMSYDEFGGSPQIFFEVAHELDYTIEQY